MEFTPEQLSMLEAAFGAGYVLVVFIGVFSLAVAAVLKFILRG